MEQQVEASCQAAGAPAATVTITDLLFEEASGTFTSLFYGAFALAVAYIGAFTFLLMRYFKVVQENQLKDIEMTALERVLAVVVDKMRELEAGSGEGGSKDEVKGEQVHEQLPEEEEQEDEQVHEAAIEQQPPPKTGEQGIYIKATDDFDNRGTLRYEAWELLSGGKLRFGSTYAREGKWQIDHENGGQVVFMLMDIGWEPIPLRGNVINDGAEIELQDGNVLVFCARGADLATERGYGNPMNGRIMLFDGEGGVTVASKGEDGAYEYEDLECETSDSKAIVNIAKNGKKDGGGSFRIYDNGVLVSQPGKAGRGGAAAAGQGRENAAVAIFSLESGVGMGGVE